MAVDHRSGKFVRRGALVVIGGAALLGGGVSLGDQSRHNVGQMCGVGGGVGFGGPLVEVGGVGVADAIQL